MGVRLNYSISHELEREIKIGIMRRVVFELVLESKIYLFDFLCKYFYKSEIPAFSLKLR